MDDVRWLSYEEAADALAITLDSARVISRRKRWPRRKGNDRKTRIGVPENLISSRNLSANGSERLARSVPHMGEIVQRLQAKGVGLRIVNLGIDTTTPTGKLM